MKSAATRFRSGDGLFWRLQKDRLKKLAEAIEALAAKDNALLEKTQEVVMLRRTGAVELHTICASFVCEINRQLSKIQLQFDPGEYTADAFGDVGANLLQINARGRILQIEFASTPEMISTENFRVPHILEGSIRCFNQQSLDQSRIEEQFIFYCLERKRNLWRFFDARTYRSGPFDREYLISLMEQLV
jgi:hypothetical protein